MAAQNLNGLFLDGIFEVGLSPNCVRFEYPRPDQSSSSLTGLLVSEPTLSSANKWGPILSDVSNLQDIASLLGSSNVWSWIGASVMCWKGTDSLKTNVEFYLINYKRNLGLEQKLKELNYLTSLFQDGEIAVKVHGGYQPQVLADNPSQFQNPPGGDKKGVSQDAEEEYGRNLKDYATYWKDNRDNVDRGTVTVSFGNKITISRMLVSRLDVTPSIVEVPDGKPLYYRVSVGLIGAKPLLSTEVDKMYKL